ncbi:hypothetical protein ACIBXA_32005 [Micromonospora echinaurantiaca]|uniref:hypothetical protein n=1 Tax=Micromonospora echinaurantiaca TaxID=47857 RepID=UPI0037BD5239
MTAVISQAWGAYEVNHVVSAALAVARSRAAVRGESTPRLSDVAVAVLSAPDSLASAALTAVGIPPQELLAELPIGPAPVDGNQGSKSGDERMSALFARADGERRRTNDDAIGSIHLAAALAGFPDAELAALHGAGIDLDLLRTGVARTAADVARDDRAFAPAPRPRMLVAPETPEIADLVTRTGRSRSAVMKQILDSQVPAGPNATSSPYSLVRVARWARLKVIHQLMVVVTLMIAVRCGMHWWLYLPLVPALATPTELPAIVWLAIVVAAVVLSPDPVVVALVLTAAVGAGGSWCELWMKRVDLGDPGTTPRDIRRAARNTGKKLVFRKLGLDDDD